MKIVSIIVKHPVYYNFNKYYSLIPSHEKIIYIIIYIIMYIQLYILYIIKYNYYSCILFYTIVYKTFFSQAFIIVLHMFRIYKFK